MNFIKKKLALAIGSSLIAMSVLVSGCSTGSDKKADTIKIGVVAELTGNNATYGTSITNGIKLAVQQLNDTGGLLGKKIELVVADNKSEPAEAANAMSKLVNQDKAPVVMGLFASSSAIAASNVSEAAKVPFLAVGATNPKVTLDDKTGKVKPNTFRVCFIDPFQGTVGANFILNYFRFSSCYFCQNSFKVGILLQVGFFNNNCTAFFHIGFFEKFSQTFGIVAAVININSSFLKLQFI